MLSSSQGEGSCHKVGVGGGWLYVEKRNIAGITAAMAKAFGFWEKGKQERKQTSKKANKQERKQGMNKEQAVHAPKEKEDRESRVEIPCFALAGGVMATANFPNIIPVFPLNQQLHKVGNNMETSTFSFIFF